jgi:hypothetical protein
LKITISNVKMINLPSYIDDRGILTSIEEYIDIPFKIQRIFYLHHIEKERGGHAHIDTDQVLIPIYGNFKVTVFDGESSLTFSLNDATKGLYIPRLIYIDMSDFSRCAICLVLANTHYDIKKSLRKKQDYINYLTDNHFEK